MQTYDASQQTPILMITWQTRLSSESHVPRRSSCSKSCWHRHGPACNKTRFTGTSVPKPVSQAVYLMSAKCTAAMLLSCCMLCDACGFGGIASWHAGVLSSNARISVQRVLHRKISRKACQPGCASDICQVHSSHAAFVLHIVCRLLLGGMRVSCCKGAACGIRRFAGTSVQKPVSLAVCLISAKCAAAVPFSWCMLCAACSIAGVHAFCHADLACSAVLLSQLYSYTCVAWRAESRSVDTELQGCMVRVHQT